MNIPDDFLAKLLDELRPREREALGLRFLNHFSVPDVGQLLGIKPDSASGHLAKGISSVAKIVDGKVEQARDLLDLLGNVSLARRPSQTVRLSDGETQTELSLMPHRQVMGGIVREDHTASDITAFFIAKVNGRSLSVAEARAWYLRAVLTLGLSVRRHLLAEKKLKAATVFELEASRYFFPVGYGCAELYYERDFSHPALMLPMRRGQSLLGHIPPMPPLELSLRNEYLPHVWPLRVLELGQYERRYDDEFSRDLEEGLRRR